jgi:hypothetical protein
MARGKVAPHVTGRRHQAREGAPGVGERSDLRCYRPGHGGATLLEVGMRAAIYCRLSKNRKGKKANVHDQERDCRTSENEKAPENAVRRMLGASPRTGFVNEEPGRLHLYLGNDRIILDRYG